MEYNQKHYNRKNQGFTLVEMVVVIVILMILISISVVSMVSFQDTSAQLKRNDTAEMIFSAAQSKIIELKGNGGLTDLQERLQDEEGNYKEDDIVPVFAPDRMKITGSLLYTNYITRTVMASSTPSSDGRQRVAGSTSLLMYNYDIWGNYNANNILISLRAFSGDYDIYMEDPTKLSEETRILFELITDTISDRETLNQAICIEIAPEDGQIFSVFCSTTATELYYGNNTNKAEGRVDISQRYYQARINKNLGYYGVDSLTHIIYEAASSLELGELSVDNSDTLNYQLVFKEETEGIDFRKLDYTITVYDSITSRPALKFTLKGADIAPKADDIRKNLVACDTIRYDAAENQTNIGSYKIPVYWEYVSGESNARLGFILDAADASASTALLINTREPYDIRNGEDSNGTFANTLSFFRFGTWTEMSTGSWTDMIYVKVTVSDDTMEQLSEPASAQSGLASPYFAYTTPPEKRPEGNHNVYTKTCDIENGRHFYNIRYFEDLEINCLGLDHYSKNNLNYCCITYQLKNDINWKAFAERAYYASVQGTEGLSLNTDFPSFMVLRDTDVLNGYRESAEETASQDSNENKALYDNLQNSYAVSNLTISMTNNMLSNLYLEYAQGRDKPTGLFLENLGTIQYFAIDQSVITGQNKVGALCGVNRGQIEYSGTLSTRTDEHPEPTIVRGIQHVGGVFGYQGSKGTPDSTKDPQKYELHITHLTNYARVLGTMYVGGITGRAESANTNGMKVQINDTGDPEIDYTWLKCVSFQYCENYGQVRGVLAPLRDGETINWENEEEVLKARQSVRYIGGIVGYMKNNNGYSFKENGDILPVYNYNRLEYCYNCPVYDANYDQYLWNTETAEDNEIRLADELAKIGNVKHCDLAEDEYKDLLACLNELNYGYYVGGLIGYGKDIRIMNSGNRWVNDTYVDGHGKPLPDGYIFGDRYVGGIIGFCDSRIESNVNNGVTVCGNSYVGGFAGCNALAKEEEAEGDELLIADVENTDSRISLIDSKINRGNVLGLYDYVGGIAGYNAGSLSVSYPEYYGERKTTISGRNYVGGITGRNEGKAVCGGKGTNVAADIDGENFVGGLVGYIGSSDPVPAGESIYAKGSISANGSFAGGIAGIIMNPDSYSGNARISRPNLVAGRYFVGGMAGANIMNPASNITPNYTVEYTNAPEIYGTAFVGGYIGYNALTGLSSEEMEALVRRLAGLEQMEENHALTAPTDQRSMAEMIALVRSLENLYASSDRSMTIKQDKMSSCRIKSIAPLNEEGLVYAAGVVGYNTDTSILNFESINNDKNIMVDLITTTAIETTDKMYDPETHTLTEQTVKYAYTGNLIGVNNERSTITNCVGYSTFSTQATYRGGLCEVNNGTIQNPRIQLQNDSDLIYKTIDDDASYLGGVCGRNNGTISADNIYKATLKGNNVLGMIAAENYGKIYLNTDSISNVFVDGGTTGKIAGIIVGRNIGEIINQKGEIKENTYVYVHTGDCAGGFIGEQIGTITMDGYKVLIGGGPSGYNCVQAANGLCGGLIGRIIVADNNCIQLKNCAFGNDRDMQGLQAGGLVGAVEMVGNGTVTIEDSYVRRFVIANGAGEESMAGGILAYAHSLSNESQGTVIIRNCYVATEVENKIYANQSAGIVYDAGGITVIDRCRNHAPKVGYGITATKALAITNCYDASLKGIERFGSVTEHDAEKTVFSNNYTMLNSNNYNPADDLSAYPEKVSSFGEQVVTFHSYQEQDTAGNDIWAFYADYMLYDEQSGASSLVTSRSPVAIEYSKKCNPGKINDFNSYKQDNIYSKVDTAFLNYLQTHSVVNSYLSTN